MYYVYVLKSVKSDRIYIGVTSDIQKRLVYHNTGKVTSTKPYFPYTVIYTEEYELKKEALQRERQIKKSGKLRKMLKYKQTLEGPIV